MKDGVPPANDQTIVGLAGRGLASRDAEVGQQIYADPPLTRPDRIVMQTSRTGRDGLQDSIKLIRADAAKPVRIYG